MELISMTCRNCGGKLQINKDADQILCQNCGTEYLVSFNEGAISIKLLSQGLENIKASTDRTASELAIVRINEDKKRLLNNFFSDRKLLFTEEANAFLNNLRQNSPTEIRSICESTLEREESKLVFFKVSYIRDLEKILESSKQLELEFRDLVKLEQYHRGIVNKQ